MKLYLSSFASLAILCATQTGLTIALMDNSELGCAAFSGGSTLVAAMLAFRDAAAHLESKQPNRHCILPTHKLSLSTTKMEP